MFIVIRNLDAENSSVAGTTATNGADSGVITTKFPAT
jgi:hypothetical protein